MQTQHKLFTILVAMFAPAQTIADSGEAIGVAILVLPILALNYVWPLLLPFLFLKIGRDKYSSFVFAVCLCYLVSWSLAYAFPKFVIDRLYKEYSIQSSFPIVLFVVIGAAAAIFLSLRIVPRLRDFNNSHD